MAANTVNGSGNGARSGAQTLLLLAAPLNDFLLRALAEGPKRQVELQQEADFPAQTTLRAQLRYLVEIGAIAKERRDRFPGALEYELVESGLDLLAVARILERWLARHPDDPLPPGGGAARAVIKALAEGWSSTMLRALAAGPISLTELDGLISTLSYPSLERRLVALRRTGLVVPCPGRGRGRPFTVTDWARQAVVPLAAAARWEQKHLAGATPIARLDAEAAFLLAVPLLTPAVGVTGSCRLAVKLRNGRSRGLAGVTVAVKAGGIHSCVTDLQNGAAASVIGSPLAWLEAMVGHDLDRLELGGDRRLARGLLEALSAAAQYGVPI